MFRTPKVILIFLTLLAATRPAAGQPPLNRPVSLQPGDVLKVEVWREGDLSGEFLVNESGTVTLPLLGPREAAGIPFPELRDSLLADYRRELSNPPSSSLRCAASTSSARSTSPASAPLTPR